ncbi:uncharacterized protein LOC115887728 isoform X2 [Sitophilus oryzae]|uniref:Uncharacterized protein LOC115887728 isoform X2 n=1 Tax=Sitophilus oryzae TaxID=7048 RepID=A0A6J2YGE0_SITOR|nr:uncharacterized protein LOC115887728 isoform X2 [Sitophilus oryzae]
MKNSGKTTYTSCIKINGKPILPPVITPELRKELLRDKHQAIKLEQRINRCRELKKHLNDLLSANDKSRPCSQLTFGDNSHIEALNISDRPKYQRQLNQVNLTSDLIEVSQYDNSGIKSVQQNTEKTNDVFNIGCTSTDGTVSSDSIIEEHIESCTSGNQNELPKVENTGSVENEEKSNNLSPLKPRLIRSNSYTLESPSPVLLAYLQNVNNISKQENNLLTSKNWASLENNYSPYESSDFESLNTVCYNVKENGNDNKKSDENIDETSKNINEVKSPTIEVYQTDISVQQITLNTVSNSQGDGTKEEKREDIPEAAANQILELLKKQHIEQKERLERYDTLNLSPQKQSSVAEVFVSPHNSAKERCEVSDKLNSSRSLKKQHIEQRERYDNLNLSPERTSSAAEVFLSPNDSTKERCDTNDNLSPSKSCLSTSNTLKPETGRSVNGKLSRSSTFSVSPSQSLYYSINSDCGTLTAPSTPSIKLIDLENDVSENMKIGVLTEKNGYWEGVVVHEDVTKSCSKELFPQIDLARRNNLKKEWAASVIGAHVRGYLTRRLLRTEKVQSLIATVKDVLLCALELHQAEHIDEKDVELHRRLINQLTAALYSFHEIFFDLTIPERMLIIAADRQHKLGKLKRSLSSSKSSRSLHSSSSSRSLNLKQTPSSSPSLTKV